MQEVGLSSWRKRRGGPNARPFVSLDCLGTLRLSGHYLSGFGTWGAQVAAWRVPPIQPLSVLSLSGHRHSWPKRPVMIGCVLRQGNSYGGSSYRVRRQGKGIVL